jgi:glycosyltransferase involved in cell wall biosynthesis
MHAGVDTDLFRPGTEKEERPTIVFVGRITKEKGCDLLVKAVCKLAEQYPNLQLWLIGRILNDKFQEEVLATARAFPNLLKFFGHIERQDLPAYLSRAHVFGFVPEFETGPSNACLEAMASGVPVIITRVGGMPEMVTHGETGLIIPKGDLDALVAALRRLIGDEGLRANMGARARDYAVKIYDRQMCLRRIEAFYKAVATGVDDFEGKTILHPGGRVLV